VEVAQVKVQFDKNSLRLTERGLVAADLTISEGGVNVEYSVYLRKDHILLQFVSTDRNRVELAARLLKRAGVGAEVTKEGGKDVWYIKATTDTLAAGRKELRKGGGCGRGGLRKSQRGRGGGQGEGLPDAGEL